MLKLSILITATERVTAPMRRVRSAIRGMVVTGERDVKRLDRMMERLNRTANRLGTGIGRSIRWGAAGAGAGIAALGVSIFRTGSKFEQFQAVLEGTEGSASAAKSAMSWVEKFAKRTPYELDQVMESFVQMKAYGIDPMNGALESLGNAASGMNKGLLQAVEMLADAQTGEFERLKEFGVRAKQQGEKVTLTYTKAGKDVTVTANKSAADIQKALLGIFDERFKGQMKRQSTTMSGILSNLKGMASGFSLKVANAGIFDKIKGKLSNLLARLEQLESNGTLDRWAKNVSDWMGRVVDMIGKIDFGKLRAPIADIASILSLVGGIARFVIDNFGLFNTIVVIAVGKAAFSLYGLAAALGVVSVAGAPLWLVVGVIAAIAAGAILVWKNWDSIVGWFKRTWASLKATFSAGAAALWNSLPWWLQKIFQGVAFAIKFNPITGGLTALKSLFGGSQEGGQKVGAASSNGQRPDWRRLKAGPPMRTGAGMLRTSNSMAVGGRIDLRIQSDRDQKVRVAGLRSENRNVPIDVSRAPLAFG